MHKLTSEMILIYHYHLVLSGEILVTLLHFDQKSDGRIVGFSTLLCRIYDTMIFFKRRKLCISYPTSLESIG